MRVLQVNNHHYLKGGSERVYLETSRLLREKGREVIEFSVADAEIVDTPYREWFAAPVDFFGGGLLERAISSARFVYSREAKRKLEALIERHRPDVAHLHIFYGRLTSAILPVFKRRGIPVVMTVHEFRMLCPVYLFIDASGEICERCARGSYYHCALKRCNRGGLAYSALSALECYVRDFFFPYEKYVDRFIMVSGFIEDKHLKYRPALEGKTARIYNFIDAGICAPSHVRGEYYLYAGRLSREKGVMTLLKAWKEFPRRRLKIAGDGPLRDEIVKYTAANNLANVEMCGYLKGRALSETIKGAGFLIVPSECYETFGLSIIEGFALGKPAIASRIGGIPEVVSDGVNGLLFESKNVSSLIEAVGKAERIGAEGYGVMSVEARRCVETRFNKDIYYEKLMDVYGEASGRPGGWRVR
ncbi:MAG: glycosyltransferase family 4 protein [Deltaproteobacteria bacterium]|nr:glycosyltransferase family 4 protein [Deltaproteobacteria bacterium]